MQRKEIRPPKQCKFSRVHRVFVTDSVNNLEPGLETMDRWNSSLCTMTHVGLRVANNRYNRTSLPYLLINDMDTSKVPGTY